MAALRLIVGLGNPGPEYARTRHNAGFRFVDELAAKAGASFRLDSKLFGETARVDIAGQPVWLLKPATFMNLSGKSVTAALRFWKFEPEQALLARGYVEHDGACVMAGPLYPLAEAAGAGVEILDTPAEDWLAVLSTAEYQTEARRAEKAGAATMLARPGCWLLWREDGVPAAGAHMVADASLCGIFDVATDPRFRRRGLAQRVLAAGAAWAAGLGATTAWLQVSPSNTGARDLYARLGLSEVYRYTYFLRD